MKIYLEKIIDLCNGQTAFAAALTADLHDVAAEKQDVIKQGHVWGWLNSNIDGIPEKYVIPACKVSAWQVTPHQLRPDIYPHPDDGLPAELRCDCKKEAA